MSLAFADRHYSRSQLGAVAGGLAATLRARGVRSGQRVALMSSNRPEFVAAVLAIWRLGAAVVVLNPAWKHDEVDHALSLTNPVAAVGDHPVLAASMPMVHLDEPVRPCQAAVGRPNSDSDALLVKVRGFQIAPAEIEAVLHGHPAVRDCAVFGIPDAASGEAVVAAVARAAPVSADELAALIAERLASYKRLSRVVFVDEIPRLASGKVLRRVLKEQYGCPSDD